MFRLLGLLVLASGGCAGVHFVSRTPDGGILAIPNDSNQWPTYYRSQAERLMRRTCPNGYAIDREEVVVVKPARDGKEAANDDEYYDYNGALQRIAKERREEYRISFHCLPPTEAPPR